MLIVVAWACLVWYAAIAVIGTVGYVQIYRHYRSKPKRAAVESLPHHEIPHVTIIRPIKGLEPDLYACLAATFRQTYPQDKLTVYFCVSDLDDPAIPIVRQLLEDFRDRDAQLFIEAQDPVPTAQHLGPNPKIRNMSRAYREAKGDLIWIIDCNVWVDKGVAGRMVDTLCGFGHEKKYKFVHQLPLVVDVSDRVQVAQSSTGHDQFDFDSLSRTRGSRLEELFLASSHAKFYTAINTVLIAPCIVGKSNMFRRSHLDALTSGEDPTQPTGIDYFSENICEDHLIGDLLWKRRVPEERFEDTVQESYGKHALVFGDLAVQPVTGMSVANYFARRVRWLRVRKFTVTLATLVEPGTESLLCSVYGAVAVTGIPWFHERLGVPQSWSVFVGFWVLSVFIWAMVDWTLYHILHSMATILVDENTPHFARGGYAPGTTRRPFAEWLSAWAGREAMALPIWLWAVYGGTTVVWRGQKFRVGMDMRVTAMDEPVSSHTSDERQSPERSNTPVSRKSRRD